MQNNIIFYFLIYSFLGWCLESIYKSILNRKPTNSGFLYGPFCPMYGIGAVIMIMAGKLTNNIFTTFIMAFCIFSIWEYIVAVVLEKLFKTKYWDYSNLKFNFQGRICLKNSIYWGILGVLLIYVIQPLIESLTNKLPEGILTYINTILLIAMSVDSIITVLKIMFIDKKIRQVFEIGETIKEKIAELKNNDRLEKIRKENKENRETMESIQNLISELKAKQDILKIKIYKRILRLKKAFPEMHSENLAKFMTQKISLEEIKNKIKTKRLENKERKK